MKTSVELPRGIPSDRVWLPVDGPYSIRVALLQLPLLNRERSAYLLLGERDQV